MADPSQIPDLDQVPVPAGSSMTSSGVGPSASMSGTPPSLEPSGGGFDVGGLLRKLGRGAAWFFGLLFVFVMAAWISLPTDSLSWRISHEARKQGVLIHIDEIKLRPWGAAKLEGVTWSFKPSRPDSTPVPFVVEELDVRFHILKYLVFGTVDVDFEGALDEGELSGGYYQSEDESRANVHIADLPLYAVPKLQGAVNAPVRGLFALDVDLTAPKNEWAKASGKLEIHCASCTVGDGETKLYVPGSKKLSKGLTIPEIDLGTLDGVLTVTDGKAVAEEFGNESDDILIKISGDITFKDPLDKSRLNLIIKFFVTPELRENNPPIDFMVKGTDEKVKMDPPDDGWLGVVLDGNFKYRRFRGIKQKTKEQMQREKREKASQRRRERDARRAEQRAEREAKMAEAKANQGTAGEPGEPDGGPANPPGSSGSEEPSTETRRIPPEAGVVAEVAEAEEAGEEGNGEEEGEEEEEEGEEEEEEGDGAEEEEGEEDEGGEEEEGGDEIGGIR
ncbi:hypothetical protein PPSIR1_25816 [Plesiocystis pacifica SIR-1]|uniref:Type II secretion system protein GspN n=1 Tax=Plesiocystis pacifica SIR-1 TaxID=391625 RepID=A6FZH7_9BACT|nr:type II secretion system protein GspN [Plesiocystis pacifica]EDM81061.1 hypothetical protein PPSIR1_25816 [Plesiocystis pacifica SIR-1]